MKTHANPSPPINLNPSQMSSSATMQWLKECYCAQIHVRPASVTLKHNDKMVTRACICIHTCVCVCARTHTHTLELPPCHEQSVRYSTYMREKIARCVRARIVYMYITYHDVVITPKLHTLDPDPDGAMVYSPSLPLSLSLSYTHTQSPTLSLAHCFFLSFFLSLSLSSLTH